MTEQEQTTQAIRRSSYVELAHYLLSGTRLVIVIVGTAVAHTAWATRVDARLKRIETKVEEGVDERWKGSDMRAWVRQANREVELWSLEAERELEIEDGSYPRFMFPDPDDIRGRR